MTGSSAISRDELQDQAGFARDYPDSFVLLDTAALWIERDGTSKHLAILARSDDPLHPRFSGTDQPYRDQYVLKLCPTDHGNAAALREVLPSLRPALLGLTTSAGFGDRLGIATPGHVRALQQVAARPGSRTIAPIFAQQSIREMSRTGRSPDDVLTDATWGAFQAGWRGIVGADADHLKTPADIDATVAAGFSFFTIDPGAYVDNDADDAPPTALADKIGALPWDDLEADATELQRRYTDQRTSLEDRAIVISSVALMRAMAKYGAAIAHVSRMYRYLVAKGVPFELEISVDETETPTSHGEHIYIVRELQRLGVEWVSLAPRYIGRFEKGVDYIGDLDALHADLAGHAAIARALGPYKLSLHSGSDKFSVYRLITEATGGLVHLKTAGTSYLEALRVAAQVDPPFFRKILTFAREHYEEDRASYHVSADVARVPVSGTLSDSQLPSLLEDFDAREVLHVTFGSALATFRPELMELLSTHEEDYAETLQRHFVRHLEPFARAR